MFTVKHVSEHFTKLWETSEVLYDCPQNCTPEIKRVYFMASGHDVEIDEGSVFIMNEHGKTVDQYHFIPRTLAKERAAA